MSIGLLRFLSIFKHLGQLVVMIFAMSQELISFLVVFLMSILGFGIAFHSLFPDIESYRSSGMLALCHSSTPSLINPLNPLIHSPSHSLIYSLMLIISYHIISCNKCDGIDTVFDALTLITPLALYYTCILAHIISHYPNSLTHSYQMVCAVGATVLTLFDAALGGHEFQSFQGHKYQDVGIAVMIVYVAFVVSLYGLPTHSCHIPPVLTNTCTSTIACAIYYLWYLPLAFALLLLVQPLLVPHSPFPLPLLIHNIRAFFSLSRHHFHSIALHSTPRHILSGHHLVESHHCSYELRPRKNEREIF